MSMTYITHTPRGAMVGGGQSNQQPMGVFQGQMSSDPSICNPCPLIPPPCHPSSSFLRSSASGGDIRLKVRTRTKGLAICSLPVLFMFRLKFIVMSGMEKRVRNHRCPLALSRGFAIIGWAWTSSGTSMAIKIEIFNTQCGGNQVSPTNWFTYRLPHLAALPTPFTPSIQYDLLPHPDHNADFNWLSSRWAGQEDLRGVFRKCTP